MTYCLPLGYKYERQKRLQCGVQQTPHTLVQLRVVVVRSRRSREMSIVWFVCCLPPQRSTGAPLYLMGARRHAVELARGNRDVEKRSPWRENLRDHGLGHSRHGDLRRVAQRLTRSESRWKPVGGKSIWASKM